MPTLSHRGISLYYEVSGNGLPLVLTHSFFATVPWSVIRWPHWRRPTASSTSTCAARGRSGPSETPFTIYDLADDVAAVLDAEGVASAVWMGLSIGGFLSLRAALARPERVRALILLDTDADSRADPGHRRRGSPAAARLEVQAHRRRHPRDRTGDRASRRPPGLGRKPRARHGGGDWFPRAPGTEMKAIP